MDDVLILSYSILFLPKYINILIFHSITYIYAQYG